MSIIYDKIILPIEQSPEAVKEQIAANLPRLISSFLLFLGSKYNKDLKPDETLTLFFFEHDGITFSAYCAISMTTSTFRVLASASVEETITAVPNEVITDWIKSLNLIALCEQLEANGLVKMILPIVPDEIFENITKQLGPHKA